MRDKVIDSYLSETLRELSDSNVPSIIASVRSDVREINWLDAAGYDTFDENQKQQPDKQFRIASVTKVYVAAAILRLAEDNNLSLDSSIVDYVSENTANTLINRGYSVDKITINHLLNHTSGLPDHACLLYKEEVVTNPDRVWTRQSQLDFCMNLGKPLADPGNLFTYSDTGYVILGEILENVTQKSLSSLIPDLLHFEKLGIKETYWESSTITELTSANRCSQYVGTIDGKNFNPTFDLFGGGGIISTVSDLNSFIISLFHGNIFSDLDSIYAGLVVPPCKRSEDSHIHSHLTMVLPMGSSFGWGHLGFWGCGVIYNPDHKFALAVSINQADPDMDNFLLHTINTLSEAVIKSFDAQ